MNVMKPCESKERKCFSPASVTFAFTSSTAPSSSTSKPPPALLSTCADHVPRADLPYQRCEYTSNRTRLRCQSVRLTKELTPNGFCEKHTGYIERIRKAGVRAKRVFDPGFDKDNITLKPVELSDAELDETLLTAESAGGDSWPYVTESLYCTARLLDDAGNPLRNAGVFTQKESLIQYQRKLDEQKAQVNELRQLYSEKLQRLYSHYHLTKSVHQSTKASEKGKKGSEKRQKQLTSTAATRSLEQRTLREHRANRRYGSYARWHKTTQLMVRAQAKLRGLPPPIPPTRLPANGCQHRERIIRGRAKLPLEYAGHQSPRRAVGACPPRNENGPSSLEEQCSTLLTSMLDHVESTLNAVSGQPGWVEVVETRVCRKARVPLSDFCSAHILADRKQALFNKCSECNEPALPLTSWNRCKIHGVSLYLPLTSVATAHHHAGASTSSSPTPTMLIPSSSGGYRRAAQVGSGQPPPLYYPHQPSPLSMHSETNPASSYHRRTTALPPGASYVFLPQQSQSVLQQGQSQQLTSATRPDGTHYYVMAPPPQALSAPGTSAASRVAASNYGWVSDIGRREPKSHQHPPGDFTPRQNSELILLPKEAKSSTAHKRMSIDADPDPGAYIRECKEQVKREAEAKNRASGPTSSITPFYLRGMDGALHQAPPPMKIVEVPAGMRDREAQSTSIVGGHLVRVNGSGRSGTHGGQATTGAEAGKDTDTCARCRPFDRSHRVKKGSAVAKRSQNHHHHQFLAGAGYHNSPYGYAAISAGSSQRAPHSQAPIVYHQSQLASTPLKRHYSHMAGIGQVPASPGAGGAYGQPATKLARMGSIGPVVRAPFQAIGSVGSRLVPSGGGGGGVRGGVPLQPRPLASPRVIYNGGLGSVICPQPQLQQQTTTYYTASGNRIFRSPYRPSLMVNNVATTSRGGPSVVKPMAVVALPSGSNYNRVVRSPSQGPPPTLSPAASTPTRAAMVNNEGEAVGRGEETGSTLKRLLSNNTTEAVRNGREESGEGADFQKPSVGEAAATETS